MKQISKVLYPVVFLLVLGGAISYASAKFDQFGYNRTAGIFNGTGLSWCLASGNTTAYCQSYLGDYAKDKLLMKWNSEWDRGNAEKWANPPYDAWLSNEWNGKSGGSGATWQYRYKWIGNCGANYAPLPSGGYCIWGQFEVLADHGNDPSIGPKHIWYAKSSPAGYGN